MKTCELISRLKICRSLEEVFPFFADASNLNLLTQEWLNFLILTPSPIMMKEGREIDYRLRLHGIPLRWRSRIKVWNPPSLFIDEQVRGPFRSWIHEHHFLAVGRETIIEDRVSYGVWGGSIIDRFLVAPDLRRIFEYRRAQLSERFPDISIDLAR